MNVLRGYFGLHVNMPPHHKLKTLLNNALLEGIFVMTSKCVSHHHLAFSHNNHIVYKHGCFQNKLCSEILNEKEIQQILCLNLLPLFHIFIVHPLCKCICRVCTYIIFTLVAISYSVISMYIYIYFFL